MSLYLHVAVRTWASLFCLCLCQGKVICPRTLPLHTLSLNERERGGDREGERDTAMFRKPVSTCQSPPTSSESEWENNKDTPARQTLSLANCSLHIGRTAALIPSYNHRSLFTLIVSSLNLFCLCSHFGSAYVFHAD